MTNKKEKKHKMEIKFITFGKKRLEEDKNKVEAIKSEKPKKEQLVNFKLTFDKYEEYKKMFGAEGLSFANGNRMCLDYIMREIRDGNLELTESGFRKTALGKLDR